jgi:hypothetical protein
MTCGLMLKPPPTPLVNAAEKAATAMALCRRIRTYPSCPFPR